MFGQGGRRARRAATKYGAAPARPEDTPDASVAVRLDGVGKVYGRGASAVHALRDVDLVIPHGTFTAVMGPSGSGKSTFLHCAAGLDKPSSGRVLLAGSDLSSMDENALTRLRRTRIGFVFQAFNLLPSLTVEKNVLLPLRLAGERPDRRRAEEVLSLVGLGSHARRRPSQLSGGQQQRVAIARALITRPDVLFADEPTGALDTTTAAEVLGLLREAVDRTGATVVMVTHDPVAASYADRVVFLAAGRPAGALHRPTPEAVAARMVALAQPGGTDTPSFAPVDAGDRHQVAGDRRRVAEAAAGGGHLSATGQAGASPESGVARRPEDFGDSGSFGDSGNFRGAGDVDGGGPGDPGGAGGDVRGPGPVRVGVHGPHGGHVA